MCIVPLITINLFVAVATAKIFSTLWLQVSGDAKKKSGYEERKTNKMQQLDVYY
jgi:hypothetical protein